MTLNSFVPVACPSSTLAYQKAYPYNTCITDITSITNIIYNACNSKSLVLFIPVKPFMQIDYVYFFFISDLAIRF
ncbi:MAG: hypothetical protein ACTSSH_02945 [Candidatus Heimdallarchaeota archaeon]